MSRTENSIKNYLSRLVTTLMTNLLNVVSRTVFIYILGADYLGINGLFSNLLAMLSLAELGIGSAINFSLYKPVAENDENKIAGLMDFYKKCYRLIAAIVFFIGMVMLLFLDYLVKDPGNVQNIRLIFFIYVVNTSYSYLLSYKTTLLNAYQKDYFLLKSNLLFGVATILIQTLILVLTRNYICYLLANFFVQLAQRLYINRIINKNFPVVLKKPIGKLETKELTVIKKNIKAMLWHKLGEYCINGTDNIIISTFLSIRIVGYYSNYLMIISMVMSYVNMIFNNMTASMGNLIATEGAARRLEVFKKINFIGVWLYGFVSVCLIILLNPFINLWLGKEYVLSYPVVAILVLNNYMVGMRIPPFIVKSAAGLYSEDKFVPIIQSILNLVVSVALAKWIGLVGVFIGTFVSGLLPSLYRPHIIYSKVFNSKSTEYYLDYIKNIGILMGIILLVEGIGCCLSGLPNMIQFLINMLLCVLVPNSIFWVIYHRKSEYIELIQMMKGMGSGVWMKLKKKK